MKGNLAFGHWSNTDKPDTYKIWANDIEYNIADASVYEQLINDLSTYVHNEVDSSIDRLDSSVTNIETWKDALELAAADNKITIEGVEGSVTVLGDDKYVDVTTSVDGSIKVSVNQHVALSTNYDTDYNASIATVGLIQDAVDNVLADSSLYLISDVSGTKFITLETTKGNDDVSLYKIGIAAEEYLNVSTGYISGKDNWAEGIRLTAKATSSSTDIKTASNQNNKLATAYDVKQVLDASLSAVDASLKVALKDLNVAAAKEENANIVDLTFTTTNEADVESADVVKVKADKFFTLSTDTNASLNIAAVVDDSKEAIADATNTSTGLATGYAVQEYVKDQLGDLANALVFRGSIDALSELPADAKVGDTYVASADIYEGEGDAKKKVADAGDMFICSQAADAEKGTAVAWTRVERNLDGAVTAGAELAADKIILGAGAQGVKASAYGIGADSSHAGVDNTVATEKWVENRIEIEDASMKDYVSQNGGKLSVQDAGEKAVEIDLTAAKEGSTVGGLGKVFIKSVDDYLTVDLADDGSIALDLVAAGVRGIVDASADGLALAKDVSLAIKDQIDALDVNPTYEANKVLISVAETDGIVSSVAAELKVNDIALTTEADSSTLSVTINGTNMLVGGDSSTFKDQTVAAAIEKLSESIRTGITGEDALAPTEGLAAVDDFVAVHIAEAKEGELPTLDSSVLVAVIPDASMVDITDDGKATAATGLATDGYVKDYVAYTLAWEVLE